MEGATEPFFNSETQSGGGGGGGGGRLLNVLSHYSCLDFTKIKALRVNEVVNFGEKSIKALIEFYKSKEFFISSGKNPIPNLSGRQEADEIATLEEFKSLKTLVSNEYNPLSNVEIQWKILKMTHSVTSQN